MTRWKWLLAGITRKLWWRTTAYGILGVLTALLAVWVDGYLPWDVPEIVGADSVSSLLNIIASSMLAVTTFSLSAMTAAYSAATTNVTPRATTLMMEDRVSQRVLSTFVGSFIFAIVGIIVLQTGAYGPSGRTVLFGVTILVVLLIVVNLLRWIDHITRLGRVGETSNRVEIATRKALTERLEAPYLGGVPLEPHESAIPPDAITIEAQKIGHITHIDMPALSAIADEQNCDIHILQNPGAFVSRDTPLAWLRCAVTGEAVEALQARVLDCFIIEAARSFDQDPRFGLSVMSEIASRALSPATNDAGTALDIIGRNTRLLAIWADTPAKPKVQHPRIHVPPLEPSDLFEDAFMLIGRDGAGLIEVQLRLQKCLASLSHLGTRDFSRAAIRQSELAFARAVAKISFPPDLERLQDQMKLLFKNPSRDKPSD